MIGTTLGQYEIQSQIGAGAQASVYLAYQPMMDRHVALKILPRHFAADATFSQRFEQEARLVARLEHAHILPVYDYGEDHGVAYLVMRYLEAGTLKDIMAERRLPIEECAHLLCQVAGALDYAHRQGVVHRDIKPANIMVDREGNAYLTDFGVAKIVEGASGLTASGTIGTPAYMSPEQGMSGRIDGRSDIYGLGVLLFQLLAGVLPFQSESAMGVIMKHISDPVPSVRQYAPDVLPEVEAVIEKAMVKQPDNRYQRASAFCEALRLAAGVSSRTVPLQLRAGAEEAIQTLIAHRDETAAQGVTNMGEPTRPERQRSGRALLFGLGGLGLVAAVVVLAVIAISSLSNRSGGEQPAGPLSPLVVTATPEPGALAEGPSGESPSEPEAPVEGPVATLPSGVMPVMLDMEGLDPLSAWEVSGDWRIMSDLYDFNAGTILSGDQTLFSEATGSRLTILGSVRPQAEWVTADHYVVTMRVKFRRSGAAARLLFSQSSPDDFYALEFSTSNLVLKRYEGGQDTIPYPEDTGLPLQPGRWYDLWVWRDGQHVTVYVNGQWALQILDLPPLPPGTIGLETLGEGGVFIDDVGINAAQAASETFEGPSLPDTWAVVPGVTLEQQGLESQALVGRNLDTDEVGPTTGDLTDFSLACQVMARQGTGAIQFRKSSGGHYAAVFEGGHVFLDRIVNRGDDVRLAEARNVYGPSAFRNVLVRAVGNHVTIALDGQQAMDVLDPAGQAAGSIALQFGEDSDFVFDDCLIFQPLEPGNTVAQFAYDIWEFLFNQGGSATTPALVDDFASQCTTCWVGPDGAPPSGPGQFDPGGFYTISAGDAELWWLMNEAQAIFAPTVTTAGQPSTNFIGMADIQVPQSDAQGGGWVSVRAAPSFVGTELEQVRVRLSSGPDGPAATVEAAGTVSQQVYYSGPLPHADEVGDGWHRVTLVAQGNTLAFFANGVHLVTVPVTDADRLLGPLAIGASPNSIASFDNVAIWDLRGVGSPDRSYR